MRSRLGGRYDGEAAEIPHQVRDDNRKVRDDNKKVWNDNKKVWNDKAKGMLRI